MYLIFYFLLLYVKQIVTRIAEAGLAAINFKFNKGERYSRVPQLPDTRSVSTIRYPFLQERTL